MGLQEWFETRLGVAEDEDDVDEDEGMDTPIPRPTRKTKRKKVDIDQDEEEIEDDGVPSGPAIVGSINRKSVKGVRGTAMEAEKQAEVKIMEPKEYEDAKNIVDSLQEHICVILKLENLDLDLAWRILDFTIGACYAMGGNMTKITNRVFIVTPNAVKLSDDVLADLNGNVDLSELDLDMR